MHSFSAQGTLCQFKEPGDKFAFELESERVIGNLSHRFGFPTFRTAQWEKSIVYWMSVPEKIEFGKVIQKIFVLDKGNFCEELELELPQTPRDVLMLDRHHFVIFSDDSDAVAVQFENDYSSFQSFATFEEGFLWLCCGDMVGISESIYICDRRILTEKPIPLSNPRLNYISFTNTECVLSFDLNGKQTPSLMWYNGSEIMFDSMPFVQQSSVWQLRLVQKPILLRYKEDSELIFIGRSSVRLWMFVFQNGTFNQFPIEGSLNIFSLFFSFSKDFDIRSNVEFCYLSSNILMSGARLSTNGSNIPSLDFTQFTVFFNTIVFWRNDGFVFIDVTKNKLFYGNHPSRPFKSVKSCSIEKRQDTLLYTDNDACQQYLCGRDVSSFRYAGMIHETDDYVYCMGFLKNTPVFYRMEYVQGETRSSTYYLYTVYTREAESESTDLFSFQNDIFSPFSPLSIAEDEIVLETSTVLVVGKRNEDGWSVVKKTFTSDQSCNYFNPFNKDMYILSMRSSGLCVAVEGAAKVNLALKDFICFVSANIAVFKNGIYRIDGEAEKLIAWDSVDILLEEAMNNNTVRYYCGSDQIFTAMVYTNSTLTMHVYNVECRGDAVMDVSVSHVRMQDFLTECEYIESVFPFHNN
ncbi:hypothetical protein PCE1_002400 [Barthelona sp. PCE]